jgi:hypothetical protein
VIAHHFSIKLTPNSALISSMESILYRILLGSALLASTSCATLYPFDYYVLREGPIPIGTEWTEIRCPDVIETTRPQKELWLRLPLPFHVPNFHHKVAVSRQDGQRVEIYAEVVDSEGKVYPLPNWLGGGVIVGRPREGIAIIMTSPKLPRTFRLTTVRLRSSYPIALSEVLWIDKRTPGPPGSRY